MSANQPNSLDNAADTNKDSTGLIVAAVCCLCLSLLVGVGWSQGWFTSAWAWVQTALGGESNTTSAGDVAGTVAPGDVTNTEVTNTAGGGGGGGGGGGKKKKGGGGGGKKGAKKKGGDNKKNNSKKKKTSKTKKKGTHKDDLTKGCGKNEVWSPMFGRCKADTAKAAVARKKKMRADLQKTKKQQGIRFDSLGNPVNMMAKAVNVTPSRIAGVNS